MPATWLCLRPGRVPRHVVAVSAEEARQACLRRHGWYPRRVKLSGYSARPPLKPIVKAGPAPRRRSQKGRERVRPLARLALVLYAALRVDWATGTISAPSEERRYGQQSLRDFVAGVGQALELLPRYQLRAMTRYVRWQAEAWWWQGQERTRPAPPDARERKKDAQYQARRLGRRKACQDGMKELDEALAGALPRQVRATQQFFAALVREGFPEDDATDLSRRLNRIAVPRP
jgi:hypothetical protein